MVPYFKLQENLTKKIVLVRVNHASSLPAMHIDLRAEVDIIRSASCESRALRIHITHGLNHRVNWT